MAFCVIKYVNPSSNTDQRRGRVVDTGTSGGGGTGGGGTGGTGGTGTFADPTANAGSLPVGSASYQPPALRSWYVDPRTGNDNNPGTSGSPKRTVAATVSALTSGDTIICRGGTGGAVVEYNEGGDTNTQSARNPGIYVGKAYTIQNYPNEAVWFDGSTAFTGAWTKDPATGFWYHSYTMRFDRSHTFSPGAADVDSGSGKDGGTYIDNALNPIAANPDQIFLDGTQLTPVANKTDLGAGKFWVEGNSVTIGSNSLWFLATNVWIGSDPTGHTMKYSNKTSLLQSGASSTTVIRGVGIRNYASYMTGFGVLYFTASNCLLENVVFQDIAATAVWTSGTANPITTGITYRHVTARRIGFQFTGGGSSDDVVIDSCDFQNINSRNFNPAGPSIAIVKLQASQRLTVKNSIFANSNCNGFWTDRTVNQPYVLNCRFQNLRHGCDMEGASNYIIAGCFFQGTGGYSIWNNDSDQGDVWNNTLVDSQRTLTGGSPFCVAQSDRRASDPNYSWMKDTRQPSSYWDQTLHPDHQYQCNGFRFHNNVVVQNSGGKSQGIFSCQSQSDTATGASTRTFQPSFSPDMDGNVYWWSGTLTYPFITTKGGGVSPNVYFNLGAFRTATGLEAHGTQPTTNPVNASYQVVDTTLHGKATALPQKIADLIGQPIGTQHAGAFLVGA